MASIKLEIVSPDRIVYSDDIAMLIVRSTGGELGILPHHAPLVTGLLPHAMHVKFPDREELIAVTVLASAAEEPIDIDINRAQRAYQRAKERIEAFRSASASKEIDLQRAEAALSRAIARLDATKTSYDK